MTLESVFINNLVELLLGLILLFQTSAFGFLWRKVKQIEDEAGKNSETVNMILHRIFGIEQDPTDEGYIGETENRFDQFGEKLEEIGEKQDKACDSRERMEKNINSIMEVLEREERVDIDRSDFDD